METRSFYNTIPQIQKKMFANWFSSKQYITELLLDKRHFGHSGSKEMLVKIVARLSPVIAASFQVDI